MSLPPSVLQASIPLGDLLDLKAFAEVCQSFVELYRVGLKVFDGEGNKLVDVKVGNADFCGYIWTKSAGREQCMATVGRVKNDPLPEEPVQKVIDCFSGCRYIVQPILYEGDAIGRVVFGLFAAWFFFYLVGEILLALPTPFHEGTFWSASAGSDKE